ncbi:DbpA RNA binding domain-containing protein [Gemmatimonadota bacterium]
MSWEFAPNFDAAFRAALTSGNNLIYVCPPAWWTTIPLFTKFPAAPAPGIRNIVLVPDAVGLRESVSQLASVEHTQPIHAATGLTRTGRFLQLSQIRTLVSTPADLLRFLSRSDLDMSTLERIVIGWPEMLADRPCVESLDTILGECRDVQRIVITSDPPANKDFLERHARRAPTAIGAASAQGLSGAARYAVTDFLRTPDALSAALDVLNPATTLVWDPAPEGIRVGFQMSQQPGVVFSSDPGEASVDLAIALEMPTPEVFQILEANARNVLLLIRAFQVPLVRTMLTNARPLRLPSEADRAHDKASRLRRQVRDDIEQHSLTDAYLSLTSLFDEYDPTTVAAALASRLSLPDGPAEEQGDVPTWVRIRIEAGKRHRIRTGDLVGALLNAVELPKNRVGRVDVREGYSLVEVQTEIADKAVRGLNGMMLRGNKLAARLDRK